MRCSPADGRRAPRPLALAWVLCCLLPCGGCYTDYTTLRMEFDSITGIESVPREPEGAGEPAGLEFGAKARRWPWIVRNTENSLFDLALVASFGLEPTLRDVDNPSGRLRRDLQEMTDQLEGRLDRLAELAWRVSWLLQHDPQVLDRIVALNSAERLLEACGGDPLQAELPALDPASQVARERREQLVLARWIALDAPVPATDADRAALARTLFYLGARPSPAAAAAIGRRSIRLLSRVVATTPDDPLRERAKTALVSRVRVELGFMLRYQLFDTNPDVREAALIALTRRAGPSAIPYALKLLGARSSETPYDSDAQVRRTLVRLCSQLPRERIYERHAGGPPPIQFLYDTASGDRSPGLRMVALDALARALGRPVDLEPEWADTFWRTEALYRDDGSTPESGVRETGLRDARRSADSSPNRL